MVKDRCFPPFLRTPVSFKALTVGFSWDLRYYINTKMQCTIWGELVVKTAWSCGH